MTPNDLDSSILCGELARRIRAGLFTLDSDLFHAHTYTTSHHAYPRGDGRTLKPGVTKIRQWLMYDLPNTRLLRVIESRYFAGNGYCQREFRRAMSPFAVSTTLTPQDRWNRWRTQ